MSRVSVCREEGATVLRSVSPGFVGALPFIVSCSVEWENGEFGARGDKNDWVIWGIVPDLMKEEAGSYLITSFVGLRSKMYTFLIYSGKCISQPF